MTPAEFLNQARARYNATSDTFWSDAEIYAYLTDACTEAAREGGLIVEGIDTSITTVAGTQNYSFPTSVVAVKRMTYDGMRVDPIDMVEDDIVTGINATTTDQGTPTFYWTWANVIYLRPLPSAAKVLKLWVLKTPTAVTSVSTLEIPAELHAELFPYVLMEMAAKDSNWDAADRYEKKWARSIAKIKAWAVKRKRKDGFTSVKNDELYSRGI